MMQMRNILYADELSIVVIMPQLEQRRSRFETLEVLVELGLSCPMGYPLLLPFV